MFRKIEKLQTMVDGLLSLFGTNSDQAPLEEEAQTTEDIMQQRLGVMILQAQDGELEERYLLRLGNWLRCDAAAMKYYVDFQTLSANLSAFYQPNRFSKKHINDLIGALP